MSEQDIVSLFNEAIDRLASGDSIDAIVASYGPRGPEIRAMLEAGLLTRRAAYPAADIRDSLTRIDSQVLPNLPPPPTFPYWVILPFLIGLGILGALFIASNAMTPAVPTATATSAPTETAAITPTIPTATISATISPAVTATILLSPTVAPTTSASVSLSGTLEKDDDGSYAINGLPVDVSAIAAPNIQSGASVQIIGVIQDGRLLASSITTATPSALSTGATPATNNATTIPTSASSVRLVIEGPVERIEAHTITIHEQTFTLPDTPALQVIQLGDVIRLDGSADGDRFIEIQIIFISVDVIINVDGQIWRDPGTCDTPPDWARSSANRWFSRCAAGPAPSGGGNSGGSSGGSNNNDDDD